MKNMKSLFFFKCHKKLHFEIDVKMFLKEKEI